MSLNQSYQIRIPWVRPRITYFKSSQSDSYNQTLSVRLLVAPPHPLIHSLLCPFRTKNLDFHCLLVTQSKNHTLQPLVLLSVTMDYFLCNRLTETDPSGFVLSEEAMSLLYPPLPRCLTDGIKPGVLSFTMRTGTTTREIREK